MPPLQFASPSTHRNAQAQLCMPLHRLFDPSIPIETTKNHIEAREYDASMLTYIQQTKMRTYKAPATGLGTKIRTKAASGQAIADRIHETIAERQEFLEIWWKIFDSVFYLDLLPLQRRASIRLSGPPELTCVATSTINNTGNHVTVKFLNRDNDWFTMSDEGRLGALLHEMDHTYLLLFAHLPCQKWPQNHGTDGHGMAWQHSRTYKERLTAYYMDQFGFTSGLSLVHPVDLAGELHARRQWPLDRVDIEGNMLKGTNVKWDELMAELQILRRHPENLAALPSMPLRYSRQQQQQRSQTRPKPAPEQRQQRAQAQGPANLPRTRLRATRSQSSLSQPTQPMSSVLQGPPHGRSRTPGERMRFWKKWFSLRSNRSAPHRGQRHR